MALFRKKNEDDSPKDDAFTPQPEKARKWFEHAKTAAMSSNFDYALQCYAAGIKLDPSSLTAHESMFEAALRYASQSGKPAASKEVRSIDDGSEMGKFAAAEFEWMKDLKNFKAALNALDAAVKTEQLELGHLIAPRVFSLLRSYKKLNKNLLLQSMNLFREVGAWDESMAAGEMARQLDPSDGDLDAQLKNLSAQRAMDQGGYEQAGESGGFRQFIKDADKQRELIEGEAIAGGASVEERNLERARLAFEAEPGSAETINRYAQLLKKRSTPDAVAHAAKLYREGFERIGEYRFRMAAGDIEIEQITERLRELDEASPEREVLQKELLALKLTEYTERVSKYPTDRRRKYELGEVQYELGEFDEAMAQFQAAKDEPRLRVRAGHMLGRCFLAETWYAEAIGEFEEALQAIDATERDMEQVVRYDLMLALLASAKAERSIDLARQAKSICSDIARRDITYRDIRVKRKEVDTVIKELAGD